MDKQERKQIAASWRWKVPKAGYRSIRYFCIKNSVPYSSMIKYVEGFSVPSGDMVAKIESFLAV